jgi:hypothetical protein
MKLSTRARWDIVVLVLLGLAISPALAQAAQSAPRVIVDQPTFDFGNHIGQTPIEHTFTLTNAGDAELRVLNVRTTCGCTVAGSWERAVPPGGVWGLPITFDPAGREGEQSKQVIVTTNDPTNEKVTFTIRGTVTPRFRIDPPTRRVVFGQIKSANNRPGGAARTVRIEVNVDEPVKLGTVEVVPPLFEARLRRVVAQDANRDGSAAQPAEHDGADKSGGPHGGISNGSQPGDDGPGADGGGGDSDDNHRAQAAARGGAYELELTLAKPLDKGTHQATVRIATGLAAEPHIELIAIALVSPDLVLMPEEIRIPAKRDKPLRRPLILRNNSDAPVSIKEVQTTCAGVTHEIQEVQPGRLYRIWLTIQPGMKLEGRSCDLSVALTNRSLPSLVATLRER